MLISPWFADDPTQFYCKKKLFWWISIISLCRWSDSHVLLLLPISRSPPVSPVSDGFQLPRKSLDGIMFSVDEMWLLMILVWHTHHCFVMTKSRIFSQQCLRWSSKGGRKDLEGSGQFHKSLQQVQLGNLATMGEHHGRTHPCFMLLVPPMFKSPTLLVGWNPSWLEFYVLTQ